MNEQPSKVEIHILKDGSYGSYAICGALLNFHDWVKVNFPNVDLVTCPRCIAMERRAEERQQA